MLHQPTSAEDRKAAVEETLNELKYIYIKKVLPGLVSSNNLSKAFQLLTAFNAELMQELIKSYEQTENQKSSPDVKVALHAPERPQSALTQLFNDRNGTDKITSSFLQLQDFGFLARSNKQIKKYIYEEDPGYRLIVMRAKEIALSAHKKFPAFENEKRLAVGAAEYKIVFSKWYSASMFPNEIKKIAKDKAEEKKLQTEIGKNDELIVEQLLRYAFLIFPRKAEDICSAGKISAISKGAGIQLEPNNDHTLIIETPCLSIQQLEVFAQIISALTRGANPKLYPGSLPGADLKEYPTVTFQHGDMILEKALLIGRKLELSLGEKIADSKIHKRDVQATFINNIVPEDYPYSLRPPELPDPDPYPFQNLSLEGDVFRGGPECLVLPRQDEAGSGSEPDSDSESNNEDSRPKTKLRR